jgi:Flp pilus assembly protein CpaB
VGSLVSRLSDRRTLRWAVTLVVAAAAGLAAATFVQQAEQVRADYGERRTVAVASGDLAVGHEVGAHDVSWVERPIALVAGDPAPDPVGRVVATPVAAGEVVLERRLAGPGATGPLALAAPGSRLVTVPAGQPMPPLALGDRVDVYTPIVAAGSAASSGPSLSGARRVARDAVVVSLDDEGVTLSVTPTEAPASARAVLDGAVTLVLTVPG